MRKLLLYVVFCFLIAMGANAQEQAPDAVEQLSEERFLLLEGQVQSLKRDVVGLSRDLHSLMKEALFPSRTQVAIYISMDKSGNRPPGNGKD